METIEIRQNKKVLIPMLILLTIVFFATNYYIYFSGKFDDNTTMKTGYLFLNAIVLYSIYLPTRKLIKNEPVLKINQTGIEVNKDGQSISFLWDQIVDWEIEKDDDNSTHHLTIQTTAENKKTNISWLDKTPGQIETILQSYKKR